MSGACYLVTGGCGFIGSHLVDALLAAGCRVRVLDDLSTGHRDNIPRHADLRVADVGDPVALDAAMAGADGCFHLAAVASVARCNEAWRASHRTNLSATVGVFERAVRETGRRIPVVYASSAAVYGAGSPAPLSEDAPTRPLSPYGADKLGCEQHAAAGAEVHGLRSIGLRFFNVYGPRQDPSSPYSGVISIFADRLARGESLAVFGDGLQSRDFIAVADVVDILLAAMRRLRHPQKGNEREHGVAEVFNACTGHATTIKDLAETIQRLSGRHGVIEHRPARPGDIRHSLGDPTRGRRLLRVSSPRALTAGLKSYLTSRGICSPLVAAF